MAIPSAGLSQQVAPLRKPLHGQLILLTRKSLSPGARELLEVHKIGLRKPTSSSLLFFTMFHEDFFLQELLKRALSRVCRRLQSIAECWLTRIASVNNVNSAL
jgi:hypothetical protein